MGRLLDTVLEFFREESWQVEPPQEGTLRTQVQGRHGSFQLLAYTDEALGRLSFYGLCPTVVPEPRRLEVAELVTRANFGLAIGNFELDMDRGDVGFKTSLEAPAELVTVDMVRRLVFLNLGTLDRYFPAVQAVAFGDVPPAEAARRVEADEAEPT